ncbi:hypothetical protein [Vreelandella venusta]
MSSISMRPGSTKIAAFIMVGMIEVSDTPSLLSPLDDGTAIDVEQ